MLKKLKKRWFKLPTRFRYALILALIILSIILVRNLTGREGKSKLETAKVTRGKLSETLTLSGTISASEKVSLKFQTGGRLVWVGVKQGDYVRRYQSIASLDQRELKKTLEKKLNDYLANRYTFDQTTIDDYKDKVLTDTIKRLKDKAQLSLNNAVLDVQLQTIVKEYANLQTPIEGIVTKANPEIAGSNVTSTNAEYEIVNPKSIYFSATADQNEVVKLKEGETGTLVLDAFEEATLSGAIKKISFTPKTDESSTVYEVFFTLDDKNLLPKLRLGMTGDLTFITAEKNNVLYLPMRFVKEKDSQKYVYQLQNGKKEKKIVQTGLETDENVEITTGLSEDNQVAQE